MEALTPGSAGDLPPLGELIADVPFWRHPCASGPFFSSSSSRARCCGLSRSRGTGPFDPSASAPPSRQVLELPPHRPFGNPQAVRSACPAASAESGVDSGHFAAHSDLAQLRYLAGGRHRS